jgi:glycosyltransferase involved in cell wall biosynthesis
MIERSPLEANSLQPLLSVIVPVYNEAETVDELLKRVVTGPYRYPQQEVLIVDDGSEDGTASCLERWRGHPGVHIFRLATNQGKGAAVRRALAEAQGAITLVQDADLEYDPTNYPRLVELVRAGQSQAVYGSRYLRPTCRLEWNRFRLAVVGVNVLVWFLYQRRLSDEATCYKALPTELFRKLDLQAEGFELCAEITAKLCRLGIEIQEVPISYQPRSAAEGKKIGWRDAWGTLWTLLRWRFARFPGKRSKKRLPARERFRHRPPDAPAIPGKACHGSEAFWTKPGGILDQLFRLAGGCVRGSGNECSQASPSH